MNQHFLLFVTGAACIMGLASSPVGAGDMKAEVIADSKLFHSHFGKTPFPNKAITVDPQGVHFFLSGTTEKPEYTALYSFFKVGGDFEISANYFWTPIVIPKGGYGVSVGIRIETNDKNHSVALARGNFPQQGSAYVVSIGTMSADRKIGYKNEAPFPTSAKKGRLILARKKNEVVCLAADDTEEPKELCRIPFTDAAVQRVLIFADPGKATTDLDAWITEFKVRADEMSHHMVKEENYSNWWGVVAGVVLIVIGTTGFLVVRRIRTGRWSGKES
jgi:hypothetical protein